MEIVELYIISKYDHGIIKLIPKNEFQVIRNLYEERLSKDYLSNLMSFIGDVKYVYKIDYSKHEIFIAIDNLYKWNKNGD